jgi:hypothetical protein
VPANFGTHQAIVCALNGSPLWNLTPGLSLNVHSLPSGVDSQLVASYPWKLWSASRITSRSKISVLAKLSLVALIGLYIGAPTSRAVRTKVASCARAAS